MTIVEQDAYQDFRAWYDKNYLFRGDNLMNPHSDEDMQAAFNAGFELARSRAANG